MLGNSALESNKLINISLFIRLIKRPLMKTRKHKPMQVISALQILSLYVRKLLREKPKSLLFKINKEVSDYPD